MKEQISNWRSVFIYKNMTYNKSIGQLGEDIACNYLEKKGYKIIERNYMVGHKEIDIIAKKQKYFIFIEVKTRTSKRYGTAVDAMTQQKALLVKRALQVYISKNKIDLDWVKLELVAIDLDNFSKTAKIKHYEDLL